MEKGFLLMSRDELQDQIVKEAVIETESHGKVVSYSYYRKFGQTFTEYMAVNGGKYAATFAGYLRAFKGVPM